jgi:hypothetical protein
MDVGEVREATMGHPIRTAFFSISDEIRPVLYSTRSWVAMSFSKQ